MIAFALSLRFVLLIASMGAAVGALIMFWEGSLKLADAIAHVAAWDGADKAVIAFVMVATDKFLFGIVLVIFAYAITFGFVFELAPETRRKLPGWARVDSIGELKHTFFGVILVYLAVDFVTDIAETETHLQWETLVMPLSILLLAGAMRLVAEPKSVSDGGQDPAPDV